MLKLLLVFLSKIKPVRPRATAPPSHEERAKRTREPYKRRRVFFFFFFFCTITFATNFCLSLVFRRGSKFLRVEETNGGAHVCARTIARKVHFGVFRVLKYERIEVGIVIVFLRRFNETVEDLVRAVGVMCATEDHWLVKETVCKVVRDEFVFVNWIKEGNQT